nr:unnamed protein product [Digitaria exilis]
MRVSERERRRPGESNDPLAEPDDGKLEQDGAVGGVEEEDLVELLALLLPPPEVEDAQLRPSPIPERRAAAPRDHPPRDGGETRPAASEWTDEGRADPIAGGSSPGRKREIPRARAWDGGRGRWGGRRRRSEREGGGASTGPVAVAGDSAWGMGDAPVGRWWWGWIAWLGLAGRKKTITDAELNYTSLLMNINNIVPAVVEMNSARTCLLGPLLQFLKATGIYPLYSAPRHVALPTNPDPNFSSIAVFLSHVLVSLALYASASFPNPNPNPPPLVTTLSFSLADSAAVSRTVLHADAPAFVPWYPRPWWSHGWPRRHGDRAAVGSKMRSSGAYESYFTPHLHLLGISVLTGCSRPSRFLPPASDRFEFQYFRSHFRTSTLPPLPLSRPVPSNSHVVHCATSLIHCWLRANTISMQLIAAAPW